MPMKPIFGILRKFASCRCGEGGMYIPNHFCHWQDVAQSIFKQSKTGLNSIFFLLDLLPNQGKEPNQLYYFPRAGRGTNRFMPLLKNRELYKNVVCWTNPQSSTQQNSYCMTTYFPSHRLSSLDTQDTAREVKTNSLATFSYGLLHIDTPVLVDQQIIRSISFVWTLDSVWRIC